MKVEKSKMAVILLMVCFLSLSVFYQNCSQTSNGEIGSQPNSQSSSIYFTYDKSTTTLVIHNAGFNARGCATHRDTAYECDAAVNTETCTGGYRLLNKSECDPNWQYNGSNWVNTKFQFSVPVYVAIKNSETGEVFARVLDP